tara:strand:+ start:431 stop:661 length:231 start_codon:yes stop_codon:yes gene_type:complete
MINDWGLTYNVDYPSSRKKKVYERESFAVKLCPECNRVYEMTHNQYKKISTTHYYKNFPKRGLYNQVCFKCKEKDD